MKRAIGKAKLVAPLVSILVSIVALYSCSSTPPPSSSSSGLPSSSSSPSAPGPAGLPSPSPSSSPSSPMPAPSGLPSSGSPLPSGPSAGLPSGSSRPSTANNGSSPGAAPGQSPGSQSGSTNGAGTTGRNSDIGTGNGDDPFGDLNTANNSTMTNAERTAVLDARLEEGYGVFDGMILTERQAAQEGDNPQNNGLGGQDDSGNNENGTDTAIVVAAGPAIPASSSVFMPSSSNNRNGEGAPGGSANYPVPDDIPTGNDDDVVARQLREAAMDEADAELREKLWDEYRNYTGLNQ